MLATFLHSWRAVCLTMSRLSSVFKKGDHGNHDHQKKDQRRLDLLVHSFGQKSSNLALSISIANPFLSSLPPHPKKVGSSRAQRESSKNKKCLADCYKKNVTFHLFVMDLLVWSLMKNTY